MRTPIADLLKNVFMHLYRNSLDHGLETATHRVQHGKAAAGHIQLHVAAQGDRVLFKLHDDGRGLAVSRIRDKAIEKGHIAAHTAHRLTV